MMAINYLGGFNMHKVKLFGTALAVIAGLTMAEVSANAAQQTNNSNDVNTIGSMVYSNAYGHDYVNEAGKIHVFKDQSGRYGIGQGTADSTAYFKINNNGTVTIWQINDDPNVPTYKQGYTKKTVSIASLKKSENQTATEKATINQMLSKVQNDDTTANQSSTSSATSASSSSDAPKTRQQLLKDEQVIDDLGWMLSQYHFGNQFDKTKFYIDSVSNGRYATGQYPNNIIYFKINSDNKTMTVWTPVAGTNNQKYKTSTLPLTALGFDPDGQGNTSTTATNSSNTAATSASSAASNDQQATSSSSNTSTTNASTKVAKSAVITSAKQTPTEVKRVARQAQTKIKVSSPQGQQTLSYYQIAAMVYAQVFGSDQLGNQQNLKLTMNKHHSRFILGKGTSDSTLYFRVNQGKKTVTVWAPSESGRIVKKTYDISTLVNNFDATANQQKLINETVQTLKEN